MTESEKIKHVFKRLKELQSQVRTIAYKDMGLEVDTHYRHIHKKAAYTQLAIEIYNKVHGTSLPHLNALIVRGGTKKPGVGCLTENPMDIFRFDYKPHYEGISSILDFIIDIKESIDWSLQWDADIVLPVADLYLMSEGCVSRGVD